MLSLPQRVFRSEEKMCTMQEVIKWFIFVWTEDHHNIKFFSLSLEKFYVFHAGTGVKPVS